MRSLAHWAAGLLVMTTSITMSAVEPHDPEIQLVHSMDWDVVSRSSLTSGPTDATCGAATGCRPIVSCCEPLWNIYVGTIILDRGPSAIAVNDVEPADFGWRAGIDVDLRRRLGSQTQLQVRYFGVDAWDDETPFSGLVPQFGYTSNLHSTEVNLRRQWSDCLTVLGGFRWVELGEELFQLPGKTNPFKANNHMYGGQLGAELLLWGCGCESPLSVTTGVKAGIFHNRAGYRVPFFGLDERTNHTSFLGEFDITARYRLTNHWALRTGYQLLWIEGVALAGGQLDTLPPDFAVDTSGSPFYHGVTIGAELTF